MFAWLKSKKVAPQAKAQPAPGSVDHAMRELFNSWEAYRLGKRDRPREHYQPQAYSGDAAIIGSHDLMHRRTRDLVRNTAQAKRIVTALTNLVVGTGMQTYSWPFAPSELYEIVTELESLTAGELGPRLTFALESDDLFSEWSNDPKQFDAEGRLSWPEMQRMLMGESVQVGNGLLVRVFRKDYKLVPLSYQIIEREQLDQSQDRPASEGTNKIVGGVEIDRANRVVAYHVYLDHPHDSAGFGQSSLLGTGATVASGDRRMRIPAERVIDLALFHRPSASLGASWLDACGQTTWDRDSYMDSEIKSAAIDAAFAYVAYLKDAEKHGGVGFDDGLEDTDEFGNRSYKLGQTPIAATLGVDEKLELIRSARPNKDAPEFIKLLDRDTSASVGLSYYSVTGDYESTNYSSSKGAKQDEDLSIRPLQDWFACHVALPVRREFNAIACGAGLINAVRPAEFRRNERTYQRFDAVGNGRDLIDPYKEGEARTTRLRTGLSTFKEECAKAGKHWIRELMQIAVERKVAKIFGVTLDFSKSGAQVDGADDNAQTDGATQEKEPQRAA